MASSVVEIAEHVFVVEYHCYLYHLLEATGIELTKLPNTNNGTIGFPTESIDIKLTRNGKVSHYEKIQFPKRFTDVMDFYSFELEPPVFFPCYEYHVLSKNGVVLKHVLFQTQRNNFPVLLLLPEVMLDVELNDITSIHAIFHERGHEYKMDFMDVLPSVGSFLSPPKAAITTNGKAIRTSTGIDLRPKSLRILCQGDLGTCGVSAIVGFLEFITGTELSVLFLYYVTRIFMDGAIPNNDAGVELDSCVEALTKYGICSLQAWPYDVVNFCVEPSKLAFEEASKFKPGTMLKQLHTIEDMKQALDNELAFFADINFAPRTYTKTVTRTGKVPLPASFAELDADSCEHSVLVLGYDDEARHFIFQNSWGTDWGINGFGFFHYDYITHKMFKNAFTWNGPLPGNPFTSDQQSS